MKIRYAVVGTALLVLSIAAQQRPEDAVLTVYRQLEKADREGDLLGRLRLQDRKSRDETGDSVRERVSHGGLQSTPTLRYQSVAVRTSNGRAVITGNIIGASPNSLKHHLIEFVREDGEWKVAAELLNDSPFDRSVVYAVLPPPDGSFTRAGSQWQRITVASNNAKRFQDKELPWKMQATRDESFVYIRFGTAAPLPVPGSELHKADSEQFVDTGAPESPPHLNIKIGGRQFGSTIGAVVQSKSTFDENGKSNSIRYYVQYSFVLKNQSDEEVFSADTSGSMVRLLSVDGKFINVKIPLQCLGSDSKAAADIELDDANVPARILPYRTELWR
jgi:hypothetical protein